VQGEYFKSRDFEAKERVIQRLDPEVRFDFGTDGPTPNQFDPHHFSVAWEGSVLAPDTGEYEFIVGQNTRSALDQRRKGKPLIDAWVKSGNDKLSIHGSIILLGGRAYPLRLGVSKSTQGVDDSAQKRGKACAEGLHRAALEAAETGVRGDSPAAASSRSPSRRRLSSPRLSAR